MLVRELPVILSQFMQEKSGGLACLLYSIVLSKGWESLARDMQDQADMPLIDTEDKITFCLSNMMLTGSATPYLHNGIMSADEEDATNFEVIDITVGSIKLCCSVRGWEGGSDES